MQATKFVLPIIVIAQFCCTSLWFAGNAVMSDLVHTFELPESALGHLTSAVQFGFICGTFLFALLTIADRFSPSKVFFGSAVVGAVFNAVLTWETNGFMSLLLLRYGTGFCLAGIYPIGMKIAADYFEKGLGKSLGFLVGALVIGTALPHLLKSMPELLPWKSILLSTSGLAILGGLLLLLFIPDGPHRKSSQTFDFSAFSSVFKNSKFRAAAFGYFGHMWELYAFWAFIPVLLNTYLQLHPTVDINTSQWAFIIIATGGIACVISGALSQIFGTKKLARIALLLSCSCCLLSPLIFYVESKFIFLTFLLLWGMFVIADSPLFSTLVAQNASPSIKGTALTIVNCIGFAITIISIQLLTYLHAFIDSNSIYMLLALGPILGLIALNTRKSNQKS